MRQLKQSECRQSSGGVHPMIAYATGFDAGRRSMGAQSMFTQNNESVPFYYDEQCRKEIGLILFLAGALVYGIYTCFYATTD